MKTGTTVQCSATFEFGEKSENALIEGTLYDAITTSSEGNSIKEFKFINNMTVEVTLN